MLSPVCPHWADELGHEDLAMDNSMFDEPWPTFDPALAAADTVEIVVQIKGKIRARLNVSASATKDELEAAALDAVASELSGKQVMKVIVVPGKLVNIVAK